MTKVTYTPQQRRVMEIIQRYRLRHSVSPTLEEIGAALDINRITAHGHVQALVEKGALVRTEGRARNLVIADEDFDEVLRLHRLFEEALPILDDVGAAALARRIRAALGVEQPEPALAGAPS